MPEQSADRVDVSQETTANYDSTQVEFDLDVATLTVRVYSDGSHTIAIDKKPDGMDVALVPISAFGHDFEYQVKEIY